VRCGVLIDSETFLVTKFVNLKINPTQSFECAHINRLCVYVYRGECYSICVLISKKIKRQHNKVVYTLHSKFHMCLIIIAQETNP
jgi:hypothetical protein